MPSRTPVLLISDCTDSPNRVLGGGPTPGLGARLLNVPTPIATQNNSAGSKQAQLQSVFEPRSARQLPSINEMLGDDFKLTDGSAATCDSSSHLRRIQHPSMLVPRPQNAPRQRISVNSQDQLGSNPYALRADEIGPHNGVPGLGSLENLLTPPDWQPGDEPIDEDQARILYVSARDRAKKTLDASAEEIGILSIERQEEHYAGKRSEWDRQRKLDNVLLQERIKIYQAYQVYKQNLARRGDVQQQGPVQPQVYHGPQLMQQSVDNAMLEHQRYQQFQVPGSPQLNRTSPPLSGGHLYQRLQQIQQGMPSSRIEMRDQKLIEESRQAYIFLNFRPSVQHFSIRRSFLQRIKPSRLIISPTRNCSSGCMKRTSIICTCGVLSFDRAQKGQYLLVPFHHLLQVMQRVRSIVSIKAIRR